MSDGAEPEDRLTICSASYRSKVCLELSWELTARLNRPGDFTWLVVENTEGAFPARLSPGDERFTIIEGVPGRQTEQGRGSYQHAAALNKAVGFIASRIVLFLDPDFFIVRPGWIRDVLNHMVNNGLSFFGAPYHPARHTKYRYFPHVACLAVDLQRVSKQELDFTPEIDEAQSEQSLSSSELVRWLVTGAKPRARQPSPFNSRLTALRLLPAVLARRALMGRMLWPFVGMSRDVGYRIFRRFARDPRHRSECVTPVWRKSSPRPATSAREIPAATIQWLDRLLVTPKRPGYFARHGFAESGWTGLGNTGWEEYMWQGQPFGFHVQGLFHGIREVDDSTLAGIVQQFAAGESAWPTTPYDSQHPARPFPPQGASALKPLEGGGQ